MTVTAPTTRPYDEIDVSSRAFWSATAAQRERNFAILRTHRPLSWHPPAEAVMLSDPDDPGFWAVVRHADILKVSRNNDVFVSGQGVIFENAPQEILEATQSFLAMDPPRHDKIRKLVSAAFTPRQVNRLEGSLYGPHADRAVGGAHRKKPAVAASSWNMRTVSIEKASRSRPNTAAGNCTCSATSSAPTTNR